MSERSARLHSFSRFSSVLLGQQALSWRNREREDTSGLPIFRHVQLSKHSAPSGRAQARPGSREVFGLSPLSSLVIQIAALKPLQVYRHLNSAEVRMVLVEVFQRLWMKFVEYSLKREVRVSTGIFQRAWRTLSSSPFMRCQSQRCRKEASPRTSLLSIEEVHGWTQEEEEQTRRSFISSSLCHIC